MSIIDKKFQMLFQIWIYLINQKKWNGKWHKSLAIKSLACWYHFFMEELNLFYFKYLGSFIMYSIEEQKEVTWKIIKSWFSPFEIQAHSLVS